MFIARGIHQTQQSPRGATGVSVAHRETRRGWVPQDTNNVMQYSWLNEHTTIAQHIGYLARKPRPYDCGHIGHRRFDSAFSPRGAACL